MTADSRQSWDVVDLFAGPGGWSEGLRMHRYAEVGIEWDEAACATARAAGHERVQADVAALDPADFPCWGLIASPPCQAWSAAGKREGLIDVPHVIACAVEMAAGNDSRVEHASKCLDERSLLVVEPLRWALALEPEWIALEQVPEVIEFWSLLAALLGARGYKTWTGVLCAADYGVPQTRKRAILVAHKTRQPGMPMPSHSDQRPGLCLLGLKPWITMAGALGWDEATFVKRERSGDRSEEGFDPAAVPAQTLTSKTRSWTLERPATTVCADPRIPEPGWRGSPEDYADGNPTRSGDNAIKVSIPEALTLQGFRPDYPVHGSRTKQFQQVGNAIPPMLAAAVLGELVPRRDDMEAAA